jgi:Na+/H+ antiporter NhaD/arsenite permease-like protein
VAIAAAAVLLVSRRVHPAKLYGRIDWGLLMLFAGLFVVVAGVERTGLIDRLLPFVGPAAVGTTVGLASLSAVLSNFISNVPAVMLFKSVVPGLPDPTRAWLTLALSSTLAGNLTLLGPSRISSCCRAPGGTASPSPSGSTSAWARP